MRIACVGTGWYPETPGGLEKYVFGMTHALLHAGDSVDLFVFGNPVLPEENGRAYSLGSPGDSLVARMRDARSAFAASMNGAYDVLNIHFAMNALPLIPFIKHDTPRVIHFHGPWADESRAEGDSSLSVAIKERLERFIYRRADRFIVLSTAFKDILATYGIDSARIHVIPMGIDCKFFAPAVSREAVRADLDWPREKTIFFTARRLVQRVGLHELLRAARIARDTRSDFVVKIAGKGPLMNDLQRAIRDLHLEDCVELLGFVSEENLVRMYQAVDVTILPTQSLEGFGTIISESLACGTPVLVTPVGGMPEAVSALSAAVISRSPSAEHIADLMLSVLQRDLELPSAQACRTYAVEHFDWDVVIRKIRSVFEAAREHVPARILPVSGFTRH